MDPVEKAAWVDAIYGAIIENEHQDLELHDFFSHWFLSLVQSTVQSYKAEVLADDSGQWVSNALRFPTRERAEEYAKDLFSRWTSVREWRVVDSQDPVTEGA